ncbi:MAG: hypothetical protein ABIG60_03405 [Patescibacteria group bacterium]
MGKIYAKNVREPASKFPEATVDGKKMSRTDLKEHVKNLARGGKSERQISEELRKSGVHPHKRAEIFRVIKGGKFSTSSEEEKKDINRSMQREMPKFEELHTGRDIKRLARGGLGVIRSRQPGIKGTAASRFGVQANSRTSALASDLTSKKVDAADGYPGNVNSSRLSDKEPASGFKRVVNQ